MTRQRRDASERGLCLGLSLLLLYAAFVVVRWQAMVQVTGLRPEEAFSWMVLVLTALGLAFGLLGVWPRSAHQPSSRPR